MKPLIFISSVSRELRTARQLVANTLHALGYEPVWQDIFETSPDDLREMLRKKIDTCSAVLQIVGHAYGAEPPTPDATFGRCSYTQYEALYARSRKKPVYYLIAEHDLPRDAAAETIDTPRDESDAAKADAAERQRLQSVYRQGVLTAEQVYYSTKTLEELEQQVRSLQLKVEQMEKEVTEAAEKNAPYRSVSSGNLKFDVFISHSSEDKILADAVCHTLEANGLKCWIAPRDITPGSDWTEAIINGIDSSKTFVLVFTTRANGSKYVLREVARAFENNTVVIPFRVEDIQPSGKLKFWIGQSHWLDAITPPLKIHLEKLVVAVRNNVTSTSEQQAPPNRVPQSQAKNGGNSTPRASNQYLARDVVVKRLLAVFCMSLLLWVGYHFVDAQRGKSTPPTSPKYVKLADSTEPTNVKAAPVTGIATAAVQGATTSVPQGDNATLPNPERKPPEVMLGQYAVIEIGSKGVKRTIATFPLDGSPTFAEERARDAEERASDVRDLGLVPGQFSADSVDATFNAVVKAFKFLNVDQKITTDRIAIVASSGVVSSSEKTARTAELLALRNRIFEATSRTVDQLVAKTEVELMFKGIVESKHEQQWSHDSLLIDIGSGNTKFGAYIGEQFVVGEVRIGSGSASLEFRTNVREGMAPEVALKKLRDEFVEELRVSAAPFEGKTFKHIYLSGGIVWAMVNFEQPADFPTSITTVSSKSIGNYQQRTLLDSYDLPTLDASHPRLEDLKKELTN